MLIRAMTVQNFRCVLDAALPFERVTTLVGRNGSGKSCFLRALSIFYTARLTSQKTTSTTTIPVDPQ